MTSPRPTLPTGKKLEASGLVRRSLWFSQAVSIFIRFSGIAVIVTVFAILAFILLQALPLFQPLQIKQRHQGVATRPGADIMAEIADSDLHFQAHEDGRIAVLDSTTGALVQSLRLSPPAGRRFTSVVFHRGAQLLAFGDDQAAVHLFAVELEEETPLDKEFMKVRPLTSLNLIVDAESLPNPELLGSVQSLSLDASSSEILVGAIIGGTVHIARAEWRTSPFGRDRLRLLQYGPVREIEKEVLAIRASLPARGLIAGLADGSLVFLRHGEGFEVVQRLNFADSRADVSGGELPLFGFLHGGMALAVVDGGGPVRILVLAPRGPEGALFFKETHQLRRPEGAPLLFSKSMRNRSFLVVFGREACLYHSTTGRLRWRGELPFAPRWAEIGGSYQEMFFAGANGQWLRLHFSDPHPEASLPAYFGPVHYEGRSSPSLEWQSTGGGDDFEPKLSLVPLLFGSFKGTAFAMLFAVPLAFSAAVYSSQFIDPRARAVIKPVVEMLAAVPTVIIGFLAAVWLAPQLKDRIPGLLLWLLVTPLVALALGAMFSRIPRRWRAALRSGWEFLVFLPLLLALGVSCWLLSPVLDEWFFQVRPLPEAEKVADFQLWWQVVTGGDFAQQNALIIGFALGLAVLPFIFSLAEDSLSAVPRHLIAGSLALGASRWQTVARVVIPSASAGMFSAFVIGFGRAMGETMIVMMAVANTPILDFSPFTGMRPLSSTIAIELPEAAFGSTLYRTLFLGAAALFLITFVANTLAEVLRNSLRRNLKSSR